MFLFFIGGLPKALDYGPHDITFKSPSHINKNLWYELSLSISNVEAPWNKYPLIVCKCKDDLVSFGVEFQFEKSYEFKEEVINNILMSEKIAQLGAKGIGNLGGN